MFVAGARALSSGTPVASCSARDDSAHAVLPRPVAAALRAVERGAEHHLLSNRVLGAVSLGMVDHLALRTRAIDTAVQGAVSRGAKQLVILGAGLDTRAHRLAELRTVRVFEVDHPGTQTNKQQRAARLPRTAASVTYVPMDFARDSLDAELQKHGHDTSARTCFIWEGVTPYLTEQAVLETLRVVRARSTPGSELLMTYAPASLLRVKTLVFGLMRALGEPLQFLPERAELAALLQREGFAVVSDTSTKQWRWEHAERATPGPRVTYERLVVARAR